MLTGKPPLEILLATLKGPVNEGKIGLDAVFKLDADIPSAAVKIPRIVAVGVEVFFFGADTSSNGITEEYTALSISTIAYMYCLIILSTSCFVSTPTVHLFALC